MKVLVVIPAFNEEAALAGVLRSLQVLPEGYEIVVVDDGSVDRTRAVASEFCAESQIPIHVVSLPVNGGIGVAVQTGYRFAARFGDFEYAVQFDGDGQHDAEGIADLVATAQRLQADLVVGSRFLTTDETKPSFQSSLSRRLGIRVLRATIFALTGQWISDPTSGFRCVSRRAFHSFAEQYPDDYPEPESLVWCLRNRLKVVEIPARMFERRGGVSSIRPLAGIYYVGKVIFSMLFTRLRNREFVA